MQYAQRLGHEPGHRAGLVQLELDGDAGLARHLEPQARMRVISLDWMASVLAGLGCGFTIHEPEELRASVRAVAGRPTAAAGRPRRPSGSDQRPGRP